MTCAVLASMVMALTAGCARPYHEASWPDLVTARQQDAIDRGWMPEFLPEAATDVHQRNEPAADAGIVVASLPEGVAIPECTGDSTEPVPLDAAWFPIDLTGFDDPTSCPDGWTMVRDDTTIALWHVGVTTSPTVTTTSFTGPAPSPTP